MKTKKEYEFDSGQMTGSGACSARGSTACTVQLGAVAKLQLVLKIAKGQIIIAKGLTKDKSKLR